MLVSWLLYTNIKMIIRYVKVLTNCPKFTLKSCVQFSSHTYASIHETILITNSFAYLVNGLVFFQWNQLFVKINILESQLKLSEFYHKFHFNQIWIRMGLYQCIINSKEPPNTKHQPFHHKTIQLRSMEEHNREFRKMFVFG